MSLLLARQPTQDAATLARITAQSIAFADEQADQYVASQERQRKLNLDQQTREAELRMKQQDTQNNRNIRLRQLAIDESAERRQRAYFDARVNQLNADAAVAQGVQQFRRTAYGPGSSVALPADTPSLPTGSGSFGSEEMIVDESGSLLPQYDAGGAPPGDYTPGTKPASPREELFNQIQALEMDLDGALAAGDRQTVTAITSRLNRLQGIYYGASNSPEAIQGRILSNEGKILDNSYKEDRGDLTASNANVATATEADRIRQEQLETKLAEERIREVQRREASGSNPRITPGTEVRIHNDIGRDRALLAKDSAARQQRDKILNGPVYKNIPEEYRNSVIAAGEERGTIPRVMSDGERQAIEGRIQALQATIDGDNTTGSQTSAQEQKAPTQDSAGSMTGDGQEATLDSLLR
jgi:hypothetical protein